MSELQYLCDWIRVWITTLGLTKNGGNAFLIPVYDLLQASDECIWYCWESLWIQCELL